MGMSVVLSPGSVTMLLSILLVSRWYAIAPTLMPATTTTQRPIAMTRITAPTSPGERSRP